MAAEIALPARLSDPASAEAFVALLREQWHAARRPDIWALLASLDRIGLIPKIHHDPAWTLAPGDLDDSPTCTPAGVVVRTSFLGLLGQGGPLPQFAAEAVEATPQLLALFAAVHHRLLTCLHHAIRRCAYPAACPPERDDPTSRRLIELAATGVATAELPPRAWLRLLRWAPARLRTASGLAAALTQLFAPDLGGATVSLRECVPHTSELPESGRSRLGQPSAAVGRSFVLGDHAPDGDGWFRVRIATVPAPRARAFARSGDALRRLFTAVATLAGPLLRFDVEVVLAPGAAPRLRIGGPQPARLGLDTWLIHLHQGPLKVRHDDPG